MRLMGEGFRGVFEGNGVGGGDGWCCGNERRMMRMSSPCRPTSGDRLNNREKDEKHKKTIR